METTKEAHIAWCKERAMAYVTTNDLSQAITSMLSDLGKHPDTKSLLGWAAAEGMFLLKQNDKDLVAKFIQGFN